MESIAKVYLSPSFSPSLWPPSPPELCLTSSWILSSVFFFFILWLIRTSAQRAAGAGNETILSKGKQNKRGYIFIFFPLKQNFNFVIIRELKLEYPDCSQHISKPLTLVLLHYSGSATSPFFFSTYEKCYVEMFSDYTQLPSRKAPVIPPVAYLSS